VRVFATDELGGADERGGALELLSGEQTQGVPHEHGDAIATVQRPIRGLDRALEASDREGVRREP